jgi:hypothetical protein
LTETRFASAQRLDFRQLLAVRDKARASFGGFRDFAPTESLRGFFEHTDTLPRLTAPALEVLDLTTIGELGIKAEPWIAFREIVSRAAEVWRLGRLTLRCGFAEKTSKQTQRGYDSVSLVLSRGRLFLDYWPNGSKAARNPASAREFLSDAIAGVGLPMRIVDVGPRFRIEHLASGELTPRVVFSLDSLDPSGFVCEMPGSSADVEIDRLRKFLELFSSKRFEYSWSAGVPHSNEVNSQPGLSRKVYDAVAAAGLPAVRYELQAEFRLSGVEGIAALRDLCGPRDEVFTELCSFDLPDDNRGAIRVHTTADGHRLTLTMRLGDERPLVEQVLGISFG